jgi:hypothetical protein
LVNGRPVYTASTGSGHDWLLYYDQSHHSNGVWAVDQDTAPDKQAAYVVSSQLTSPATTDIQWQEYCKEKWTKQKVVVVRGLLAAHHGLQNATLVGTPLVIPKMSERYFYSLYSIMLGEFPAQPTLIE